MNIIENTMRLTLAGAPRRRNSATRRGGIVLKGRPAVFPESMEWALHLGTPDSPKSRSSNKKRTPPSRQLLRSFGLG